MKDLDNTTGGRMSAQALLRAPANTIGPADSAEADARTAAARAYLRARAWWAAVLVLVAAAATVLGGVLIVANPDSGGGLFAAQLVLILCGPVGVCFALGRMYVLARRRRAVRLRQWRAFPARSAALGLGRLRLTVVGIDLAPGATYVIFPEQLLRGRVRRLVEREGQVLVLWPRSGHVLDRVLFAGADGRPVFADYPAMAGGAQGFWERRGQAALDRARS